ncbi:MAG: hypothetical protein HON94_14075 [Methylococcales bacterium]|nr:hypothetical protein [Methylococcales bacterium]MBT7408737.1 hypothetical protein [Methylococcales bacterium]
MYKPLIQLYLCQYSEQKHDAMTGKYFVNGIFFYHEAHEDNEEKTSISSCTSW